MLTRPLINRTWPGNDYFGRLLHVTFAPDESCLQLWSRDDAIHAVPHSRRQTCPSQDAHTDEAEFLLLRFVPTSTFF